MLFKKSDFKESWINFSENFNIPIKDTVYLGANGIGKTTIYDTIKLNYPLLGFFSYDDCKEKIIKEKKKIEISIRTVDIEKLNTEKQKLLNILDIKKISFKRFDITSVKKAQEYSEYCKEVYNDNEKGILQFESEKLNSLINYENTDLKKFILQNADELLELKLLEDENHKIKEKFILEALKNLEKSIDDVETICPVCGFDHETSIVEIYNERKKMFEDNINSLIDKYRINTNKNKKQIIEDIKEMTNFVVTNKINSTVAVNYIIINEEEKKINEMLLSKNKIKKINKNILDLESERDEFFSNIQSNWNKIEKVLQKAFKDDDIKFSINEDDKKITLNLKRETESYSTGELNYIVFLINVLEFEYSNKTTIVIDDPLSSFDIKKQYKIVFDIINRLIENKKKVIIFTHNINLINIINSQHPKIFEYRNIDMIDDVAYVNDIILPKKESILNIENLYNVIDDNNKLKPWLNLLIKKDTWGPDSEYHKIFHFDDKYNIGKLCNEDLVKLIDDFNPDFSTKSFELQSLKKIIYLSALRVWVEKKMKDNFNGTFDGINELYPKINHYFKNRSLWKTNLNIEQSDLTSKKVLLNQNNHYKSQIIPFHYAVSISCDDLQKEILEIKDLFKVLLPV